MGCRGSSIGDFVPGEGAGWYGEVKKVILEGEAEGVGTANIFGNKAISCPEKPLVDLFILLNTSCVSERQQIKS
ncbi:hypothetical protein Tco_0155463 [Tanacetum coccineum]